jgi:hypothetical protein
MLPPTLASQRRVLHPVRILRGKRLCNRNRHEQGAEALHGVTALSTFTKWLMFRVRNESWTRANADIPRGLVATSARTFFEASRRS